MPINPPSVDAIFLAALEKSSPEERAAYLDAACGDDSELRQRVERLLAAHPKVVSFLESPAPGIAATIDQPVAEQPGTHIGPYKLHEEIGEGGMGSVFLAVQKEPIRRKVALKVIKPGMDSKQVVSRFEAERQALAMMDHPNIARVIDGGATESGRPYFVMELVKGIPITDYCDRYRATTNDRLKLFGDVCSAVQHAHQKGIIHRDLKPSNILVTLLDGKAIPKVIDFGIAKATSGQLTDDTMVTNFAQMIGTPLYMSPEQAEISAADVDTRSDVYSLGVLLYELLTGTTPFDRERMSSVSYDEFRQIIREEDPPRPSNRLSTLDAALDTTAEKHHTDPRTLAQQVSGELDWIVMKSLEKDRTRRYESANDLAKDVQRYLDDEAVEACPPSTWYRLRKYAKRRKALLTTATLLTATMIAATAVSVFFAFQANAEKDKAVVAQGLADKRLAQSRLDFDRALQALDTVVEEVSSPEFAQIPGVAKTRSEVLQRMLALYEAIAEEHDDDPYARQQQALAYGRIWKILNSTGQPEEAGEAINQGISILDELLEANPDDKDHKLRLAELLRYRATSSTRRHKDRIKDAERALAIRQELVEPSNIENFGWIGTLHFKLAYLLPEDSPRAAEHIADSIRISEEHGLVAPAESYFWLAKRAEKKGDFAEAEKNYRIGLEACPWSSLGKAHPWPRAVYCNHCGAFAKLLNSMGRFDEARTFHLESIEVAQQLYREYGKLPTYEGILGNSMIRYGRDAKTKQQEEEAVELIDELIADLPEVVGLHPIRAELMSEMDDAEARLSTALEEYPQQADYYFHLGRVFGGAFDSDKPLADCEDGLAFMEKALAKFPDRPHLAAILVPAYNSYGDRLRNVGQVEDAEKAYRRAVAICKNLTDADPESGLYWNHYFDSYRLLIKLLKFSDQTDEMERLLQDMASPRTSGAYSRRGRLLGELGEVDRALADLDRAVGVEFSDAFTYFTRGSLYLEHLKDYEKALADLDQSLELDPNMGHRYKRRAEAHFHLGNYDDALADLNRAVELTPNDLSALSWIPLNSVAVCPDESFRVGLLELADQTIELTNDSARAYAARGWLFAAFGQPEKALTDLKSAFDRIPNADELGQLGFLETCYELGNLCGELAHRPDAIPYLVRLAGLQPESATHSYRATLAQLGGGLGDSYRDSCRAMLERFRDTETPNDGYWVAWTCLLGPGAVDDYGPVVRLAEQAVEADPDSDGYLKTLGGILYRAGRFEEAVERLTEANTLIEAPDSDSNSSPAYTWYLLAMAHQKLGHGVEARKWMQKATEWTEKILAEHEEGTAALAWNRELTLKLLREEAEALLDSGESSEESNEETTPPTATQDSTPDEQQR